MTTMIKTYQKLIAAFSLASLLIVVSGFCYAPISNASMGSMHLIASQNRDCNEQQSKYTISQKSIPLSNNALKPCCTDRQIPSTIASNFSGVTKIALAQNIIDGSVGINVAQNISTKSSNNSPPKPDKLSSILRLE